MLQCPDQIAFKLVQKRLLQCTIAFKLVKKDCYSAIETFFSVINSDALLSLFLSYKIKINITIIFYKYFGFHLLFC